MLEGDGDGSAARHHQAARHRPNRQPHYGSAVLNFNNSNPFTALGQPLSRATRSPDSSSRQSATLARDGARRRDPDARRAEPARDLGRERELPWRAAIPGSRRLTACDPQTRICQLAIQFKKFGVGLNFTPVVLSEGRISLKVMTEVSELSNENAIRWSGLQHADHSGDQDPPRRDHGGNPLRRRARDGRHDPGADQAQHQRPARPDAASRCSARCSRAATTSIGRPS
jgi:hypothetical protein